MRTLGLAILVLTFLSNPVFACMGPEWEDHHFPSCTIPLPADNEFVTVINGANAFELSDHHLGEPDNRTQVFTFDIAENDRKNYIVLEAYGQTIWKFTGDIGSVSRVIVLGSVNFGADRAGVIGIPAERISFTAPEPHALDDVLLTSCTRVGQGCIAGQWFGEEPSKQVTLHPPSTQPRLRVDAFIDGRPIRDRVATPVTRVVRPEGADILVAIDPATVMAQVTPQPYPQLPGQHGVDALVASGALIPVEKGKSDRLAAFAEAFSARYRSRFDPDFYIEPTIDYIITQKVTLPPEIQAYTFLVASGVPEPDMNGNRTCYFLEDQASQAVIQDYSSDIPNCRNNGRSHLTPRDEKQFLDYARDFDGLSVGTSACKLSQLSDDTYLAVLALSEGDSGRYRNDPTRQIDVIVTRDGPIAIFVSMDGGPTVWNITGSNVVEVYGRNTDTLIQVILNGETYAHKALKNSEEDCRIWPPRQPNLLGPAIAQLDEVFDILTGQRIDALITLTQTDKDWRNHLDVVQTYIVD